MGARQHRDGPGELGGVGSGRWAWASVRKMLANVIASRWSDFLRATEWRSRYRATAIGLIE
jgi:hypothetical protein